jgi:hypothetical protein
MAESLVSSEVNCVFFPLWSLYIRAGIGEFSNQIRSVARKS